MCDSSLCGALATSRSGRGGRPRGLGLAQVRRGSGTTQQREGVLEQTASRGEPGVGELANDVRHRLHELGSARWIDALAELELLLGLIALLGSGRLSGLGDRLRRTPLGRGGLLGRRQASWPWVSRPSPPLPWQDSLSQCASWSVAARALFVFVAVAVLAAGVSLLVAVLVRAAARRALARWGRARGSDARMPPSGIESASRPLRLSLGLIVSQSSRT